MLLACGEVSDGGVLTPVGAGDHQRDHLWALYGATGRDALQVVETESETLPDFQLQSPVLDGGLLEVVTCPLDECNDGAGTCNLKPRRRILKP